jgi:putative N-acetylmannosamine-6-phosphate epimerase
MRCQRKRKRSDTENFQKLQKKKTKVFKAKKGGNLAIYMSQSLSFEIIYTTMNGISQQL